MKKVPVVQVLNSKGSIWHTYLKFCSGHASACPCILEALLSRNTWEVKGHFFITTNFLNYQPRVIQLIALYIKLLDFVDFAVQAALHS